MNWYSYKAYDTAKHICREGMWADNEDEVRLKLQRKQLTLISIKKDSRAHTSTKKWRYSDIVEFSYRMSLLIDSGLPMRKILAFLTKNPSGHIPYDELREEVQRGRLLSEALKDTGFPVIGYTLLASGERAGTLGDSLTIIKEYYEEESARRKQMLGALSYPLFLVILMIIFTIIAIGFILPSFKKVFSSMHIKMPIITRWVFNGGDWVTAHWQILLLSFVGLCVLIRVLCKRASIMMALHKQLWRFAESHEWLGAFYMERICRIWAILLNSGLAVTEVLALTTLLWNNRYASMQQTRVMESIKNGKGIGDSLKEFDLGTPLLWELIAIGEQTGELVAMVDHCAVYYKRIILRTTASLEKLVEPVMVTIMGMGIAVLVIAVMLPMFQAVTAVNQL